MRDLGAANGLELLAVGPPERPGDTPHARLEQIGVLHAAIMARIGFWGYVAPVRARMEMALCWWSASGREIRCATFTISSPVRRPARPLPSTRSSGACA